MTTPKFKVPLISHKVIAVLETVSYRTKPSRSASQQSTHHYRIPMNTLVQEHEDLLIPSI